MRALTLKLWRDAWRARAQALAIAVVVGGGVATLIMTLSALDALSLTRDAYYREARFAEVFASLERAPERLVESIAAIPGVRLVETRVLAGATLEVEGFADAVSAELVSLPEGRESLLNRLFLSEGRAPEPGRDDEVVVGRAFAEAHALHAGDGLVAIVEGHRLRLRIVGIGLSPEFIYQIRPGDLFPDFARHGVLWMNRRALAAASDLDGAFNDLSLMLEREARPLAVLEQLDPLLEPYGGRSARLRADQLSDRYLSAELDQLRGLARWLPAIFLGVAAFLLHLVLDRLVSSEREQIGMLKAFGYSHAAIARHYVHWMLLILALGLALGSAGGLWLAHAMAELYGGFFHFPYLEFRLRPQLLVLALLITLLAGLAGVLGALRRALRLAPAEAMQPEPPARYGRTLVERLGLAALFSPSAHMLLRQLERRPLKAALAVLGIALGCAILMVGRFQEGALDHLIAVQFGLAQREDVAVTFVSPLAHRALHELAALPGVESVEPLRALPVRLHRGRASERCELVAVVPGGRLRRLLDADLDVIEPMPGVLVLGETLAERLQVRVGDRVRVEVLDGARQVRELPVGALVREFTGMAAYMAFDSLGRMLNEGDRVSGALLRVAPEARAALIATLREAPAVAGVSERLRAIQSFRESMARIVLTFALITTLLAGSLAFGVVYNTARISLAERARELATLRVLGFTQGEVSLLLLGELALLTLLAIPLGWLIGWGLITLIVAGLDTELYRIPLLIEGRVLAFAALVILASALLSGLLVARQIRRLDLLAVLKARD
ncbi:MAG: ABC transporter permease [Chromatiaceae bacterium]|nr:ABC transporter permease [Chromatiaceae bacterium]